MTRAPIGNLVDIHRDRAEDGPQVVELWALGTRSHLASQILARERGSKIGL